MDDIGHVLEEVLDVSAQWYHLGLQLKIRIGTLDSVRTQFQNPKDQLLEMLKTWLTTSDNTTWKVLTDALRSRSVGACQLADYLERKYSLVGRTELDIGASASDDHQDTDVPPSPVSEVIPTAISQQMYMQGNIRK